MGPAFYRATPRCAETTAGNPSFCQERYRAIWCRQPNDADCWYRYADSDHRRDFSPPLAGHHHIDFVTPAPGTDQPTSPLGNGSFGTVPPRHFGGIGLSLISAFEAPDDEPNTGSRRAPECQRRAGFGFHPLPPLEAATHRENE